MKQLSFARDIETAYPILLRFAQNIGFNFCALTLTSTERNADFKALQINNYSKEWNQLYEKERYSKIDPVVAHCTLSSMPIVWTEEVFAQTPHLWSARQQHGLRHGWSQSFHHQASGLCNTLSLGRKNGSLETLELYEHFGYMFYAASHLSELFAKKLHKPARKPDVPHLSARELEVLQYSAVGKTALEIATILSLSERTVNYHVQNVITKLKVCNKISAVSKAGQCGLLNSPPA